MKELRKTYVVYLLQLWHAGDSLNREGDVMAGWRASLTDPATRECRRFSNLTEMFTYIEQQLSEGEYISTQTSEGGTTC